MYSWKIIRTACFVLLLLPLVHVTWIVSRNTLATLDASPEVWTSDLDEYARQDARQALPADPVVVVGGKGVKLWSGLEEVLAPRPVIMRGLGDAIIEDITFHYERLIGYYQPDTLVLLPGHSEFFLRDSKSAEDLVAAVAELATKDDGHGITRRQYVFTPIKTPGWTGDHATIDRATDLLKNWANARPATVILDSNSLLADPAGVPRPRYFRGDGTHLNEHGYLRLAVLLQQQLEADTEAPAIP